MGFVVKVENQLFLGLIIGAYYPVTIEKREREKVWVRFHKDDGLLSWFPEEKVLDTAYTAKFGELVRAEALVHCAGLDLWASAELVKRMCSSPKTELLGSRMLREYAQGLVKGFNENEKDIWVFQKLLGIPLKEPNVPCYVCKKTQGTRESCACCHRAFHLACCDYPSPRSASAFVCLRIFCIECRNARKTTPEGVMMQEEEFRRHCSFFDESKEWTWGGSMVEDQSVLYRIWLDQNGEKGSFDSFFKACVLGAMECPEAKESEHYLQLLLSTGDCTPRAVNIVMEHLLRALVQTVWKRCKILLFELRGALECIQEFSAAPSPGAETVIFLLQWNQQADVRYEMIHKQRWASGTRLEAETAELDFYKDTLHPVLVVEEQSRDVYLCKLLAVPGQPFRAIHARFLHEPRGASLVDEEEGVEVLVRRRRGREFVDGHEGVWIKARILGESKEDYIVEHASWLSPNQSTMRRVAKTKVRK